jgi:arylsulfatase A-like enzyme
MRVVGMLLAVLFLTVCCGPHPEPQLQRTVLRLDASDFGVTGGGARGPLAVIGEELRPVVAGPHRIAVIDSLEITAGDDNLRLPIALPKEAAELSDASFSLEHLSLSEGSQEMRTRLRELVGTEWVRVDDGWTLSRKPGDAGSAVLEIDSGVLTGRTLIRLEAFCAPPRILESRYFDLPARARIEFGYGLVEPGNAAPGAVVDLSALLICSSGESRILHAARLETANPAHRGWLDSSVDLVGQNGPCRLRLTATAPEDSPIAAVWAVPRIRTRIGKDHFPPPRSLLLISLDTLRANHLSGYGYGRETSPTIDRELIARGTTFTDVSTTFPRTNIAHHSPFTGLYPAALGERTASRPAAWPIRTLTEVLAEAGLETAAFTEGGLLTWRRGFWYGFDRFGERTGTGRARETFADGVRYLERARYRQFFLFIHTYQTHWPYDPPGDYLALFDEEEAEAAALEIVPAKHRAARDDYDREIRKTDELLGSLLERLETLGLSERTYVVLLSDHGEAFGEHGVAQHGWGPHQEEIQVPLIVRGPDVPAGRRIEVPISLVDVAPTLLEMLGLPPLTAFQGVSVYGALQRTGAPASRPIYFGWLAPRAAPLGERFRHWKVVRRDQGATAVTLYNLVEDPGEERPVRGPHPAKAHGRRLLNAYASEIGRKAAAMVTSDSGPEPDPVTERLEVLSAPSATWSSACSHHGG